VGRPRGTRGSALRSRSSSGGDRERRVGGAYDRVTLAQGECFSAGELTSAYDHALDPYRGDRLSMDTPVGATVNVYADVGSHERRVRQRLRAEAGAHGLTLGYTVNGPPPSSPSPIGENREHDAPSERRVRQRLNGEFPYMITPLKIITKA